jgi:hypothetical protein
MTFVIKRYHLLDKQSAGYGCCSRFDCPFAALRTETVAITCDHPTFGLEIEECDLCLRAYVESISAHSTVSRTYNSRRR